MGVCGTGAMGRGIAQIAAQGGVRVLLQDAKPGAAQTARDAIAAMLKSLVDKGKLTSEQVAAAVAKLEVVDSTAAFAACDVVVEAIVENLEVKKKLFAELEAIVREDCVLASNTSSLSVTAIAAACKKPARVAGYHFFNPVPVMKLVEVVPGMLTAPAVCEALTALAKRMGRTPVTTKDTPGFIVNHAGRGFGTEAFRILGEGVAEFYEIDRIMRDQAGFKLGPCELMDLTGIDVSHPVMESIYRQYYEEPRYKPSVIGQQRKDAGVLGRKTGRGFYNHAGGKQEEMPVRQVPAVKPASVFISQAVLSENPHLAAFFSKMDVKIETGSYSSAVASCDVCFVTSFGQDCTTAALAAGLDPSRTIAIDGLMPIKSRVTLMTNPLTSAAARDFAHAACASAGVQVSLINDSAGFVAQRILAMIVNIGCDIVQQRICAPADLDLAVTLGLGYPLGPLAFGDAMGPKRVLTILENMQSFYGDPRYRPSPWLKRRALLNSSLLTPE